MSQGEVRRIERWLATARVFLTISALFAIWIDPTQLGYSRWAYWLLGFYLVHGVVVMLLLRLRQQSTPSFRLLVHAADIVWPALISSFAAGQHNPFFLFFIFVLAAAAYRWGLWETWWTGVSAVLLLCLEALAVHWGVLSWTDGILLRHHLPGLGIDIAELGPKQLVMRSGYLIVMSLLLGYMAEQQKQLRAEKAVIARMLSMARVESLSGTLQQILGEILNMYGARRVVIASQEANSHRVFLGDLRAGGTPTSPMLLSETSTTDRQAYLYDSVADTCYATRKNGSFEVLALDSAGVRLRSLSMDFLPRLWSACEFRSLATVSFVFGQEWSGRIFLVDPWLTGDREEELRFLQELVRQVGPAVYNVYLMSRLRQRAGAVERARFARELHDGAVQSLIAMEMQVDVLRRQSATQSVPVTDELGRIQGLLREEVLKLRELMQQMKSMGVDAKKLANFLSDTVERFQRETGIAARFVSDASEINMPPQVCREVARIVQEGLVNIRKHSGAHHVLVRLGTRDSQWRLTVEDDGRGFPFAGRFSQTELEETGRGPLVIKERVRLIEGELTVESNPGQGSRLEISIPQKREAVYGQ